MGQHYGKQGTCTISFKIHNKTILQVEEKVMCLNG